MALRFPKGAQTDNASKQNLGSGPEDMPNRGGRQGETQVSEASKVPLPRTESHVAQFGARPGMGTVQADNASKANLSRRATSPYGNTSRTTPQENYEK